MGLMILHTYTMLGCEVNTMVTDLHDSYKEIIKLPKNSQWSKIAPANFKI